MSESKQEMDDVGSFRCKEEQWRTSPFGKTTTERVQQVIKSYRSLSLPSFHVQWDASSCGQPLKALVGVIDEHPVFTLQICLSVVRHRSDFRERERMRRFEIHKSPHKNTMYFRKRYNHLKTNLKAGGCLNQETRQSWRCHQCFWSQLE